MRRDAGFVPGTIPRVELKSFMCHDHLVIDLTSGINFITGSNGSGKSAILTALTVCLGCRASATQRGNSFDSLIKEGRNQAEVIIFIANGASADSAYRFAEYGETIAIERTIRRDGQHSFRVKNAGTGKTIDTRKEEVVAICDHFALLVDNPLVVLSQETSKKFLASSTPKDLYTFFLKATQLEQLQIDYQYIEDRIVSMSTAIDAAKSGWPEKVRRIKELENLKRDLEKYRDSYNAMNYLKRELAWSFVRSKESQAQSLADDLDNRQTKIEDTRSLICELDEKLNALAHGRSRIVRDQSESRDRVSVAQANLKDKETKLKRIMSDINVVTTEMSEMNREMQDVRKKEAELKALASTSSNQENSELQRLESEKKLKQSELDATKRAILENQQLQESAKRNGQDLNSKLSSLRSNRSEHSIALENATSQKLKVEHSRNDRLRMFSEKMPEFVRIIEANASSFHRKPVGPIGLSIELKAGADKWAVAIEALIGRELDHFIVHDHHDRTVLQELFKRVSPGIFPGVLVLNFDREAGFDFKAASANVKKIHKDASLALDIVHINSPIVIKALMINNGIERAMLLDDRDGSIRIMNSPTRPSMIDVIFTPSYQIRASQSSVSCFPIRPGQNGMVIRNGTAVLRNLESEIFSKKELIHNIDLQISDLEREIRTCNEILGASSKSENDLMKRRSAILSDLSQIEEDIRELMSFNPSTITEELERIAEKLSLLRSQFETTAERKQLLSSNLSKAKDEQESATIQCEKIEQELENLSKEYASLNSDRKETEDNLAKAKSAFSRLQEDTTGIRSAVYEAKQTAKKMRAEAEKFGEEVFSERSPKAIDEELTHVTARLAEAQKRNIDPSRVNAELKDHQDSYERSRKEVLEGDLLLNDMRHGLDKRERVMEGFRKNISQDSLVEFIVLLSARGFSGSLDYNHQSRELNLSICTDGEQQKSEQVRDIKQLSGGEKSFGTTCFLLSLWGSISAPLRCLDEFDVFMDAVNRRIVMDMLVEHARQRNFQFILITPIPLNDFLAANPDIHVVRMKEPEKRTNRQIN